MTKKKKASSLWKFAKNVARNRELPEVAYEEINREQVPVIVGHHSDGNPVTRYLETSTRVLAPSARRIYKDLKKRGMK